MTREFSPSNIQFTHFVNETCGLRPTAIDVVKTRIQIDPALKGKNMITAGRSIVLNEGPRGLLTGPYAYRMP